MDFLPFDELQKKINERYYKEKGQGLYSDFKTFGSCEKIAKANAIEFSSYTEKHWHDGELLVYEFGIGNGMFAYNFLKNLPEEISSRVSYFLCDISEKILSEAEKKLKDFNTHSIQCDFSDFKFKAHLIRINELYDDLPSKIFINDGETKEVLFNEKLEKKFIPAENKLIEKMPEGYLIPINFTAKKHLENCKKSLSKNGYIDIFDYGFTSINQIEENPKEIWNNSVVRYFGKQLTADVNFMILKGKTEPQKEYIERILKEKLYYVELEHLDYLTEKEVKQKMPELIKHGYPEDFPSLGIEKDEYFHLRLV